MVRHHSACFWSHNWKDKIIITESTITEALLTLFQTHLKVPQVGTLSSMRTNHVRGKQMLCRQNVVYIISALYKGAAASLRQLGAFPLPHFDRIYVTSGFCFSKKLLYQISVAMMRKLYNPVADKPHCCIFRFARTPSVGASAHTPECFTSGLQHEVGFGLNIHLARFF